MFKPLLRQHGSLWWFERPIGAPRNIVALTPDLTALPVTLGTRYWVFVAAAAWSGPDLDAVGTVVQQIAALPSECVVFLAAFEDQAELNRFDLGFRFVRAESGDLQVEQERGVRPLRIEGSPYGTPITVVDTGPRHARIVHFGAISMARLSSLILLEE